jgi:hypothetical protein
MECHNGLWALLRSLRLNARSPKEAPGRRVWRVVVGSRASPSPKTSRGRDKSTQREIHKIWVLHTECTAGRTRDDLPLFPLLTETDAVCLEARIIIPASSDVGPCLALHKSSCRTIHVSTYIQTPPRILFTIDTIFNMLLMPC